MKNEIILSNGSLRNYGLDRVFEIAVRCGFDGVELIVDERTDTFHPGYIRRLVKRHGLPVPVIHAPFNFLDPPGWERDEVSRVKRSVRLAEDIGAGCVVLHTPFYTDRLYLRWLEEDLEAFQETTAVIILVENMPCYRKPGGRIGRWLNVSDVLEQGRKKIWKLLPSFLNPLCFPLCDPARLERFPHIILDTTHLGTGGFNPIAVFDRLREKIEHIHLSNFDGREHLELRTGILDIAAFLRHVTAAGYDGLFCLEIMPEYFRSEDEEYSIRLLGDNLAFIRQHTR
ncbi:MAG: sugar phosphate isomerase/epimerase family protein [Candidatus Euphemobacter frigidus]|nr:sugar phosphate isomerase/epimerase family protein [Candidatus Euphemobacter frigidus]MDP8276173.1 sugar phosphate isomerase/epimerase family protein [Candidatus Euphemobacter frigidus]